MSCLVVTADPQPSGWCRVDREQDSVAMHILSDPAAVTGFWRGVLIHEPPTEQDFFDLVGTAFPGLLFASSLQFNKFGGDYHEVLAWLVKLLGAVSDHFAKAVANHQGDRNRTIAQFSAMGLDISPESPNTRRNKQAWKQRMIIFEGSEYRCDWHGKRLRNMDRVHFSLPIEEYGGKVLIGEFVDHLDT
jgi:hypothetical protein